MNKKHVTFVILPLVFASVLLVGFAQAAAAYTIVLQDPASNRNVFYGGSVMAVKFQLLDPSGAVTTTPTAVLLVDGQPAVARGSLNSGNSFAVQQQGYVFKLDTKPLSAGFGSPLHTLTINVYVGNTLVATTSFTVALH
jgi:hypothetical protein